MPGKIEQFQIISEDTNPRIVVLDSDGKLWIKEGLPTGIDDTWVEITIE